jgi:enamine deaminase RidA (YjgF/YER057c/UK114 family)
MGMTLSAFAAGPFDPPAPVPRDGEGIYRTICQGCHMPDGKGAQGAGAYPSLAGNARLAAALYPAQTVLNGRNGMPPFRRYLDDSQVAAVVNYVRTGFGNKYSDDVNADDVKKLRDSVSTPATGELTRHRTPGSDFPILMAVEVPAGYKTIYLSGVVPSVADVSKPPNTLEAYGNTETQTVSALKNIERNLKRLGLSMSDVIKMQVFLVGDPQQQGKMDFKGLMAGYTQFFGTKEQPNLPTRSVFQVSGLANPGWLVEIEVIAAQKQ